MASMMGLPPVLGLVTSITTAPITALLGRNPVLIGGTASATVPFIARAVERQGVGGAAKVCMAASVFMLVFCVLKLGRFIQKVPQSVVTGFSCGIGAMMFLSQLGVMLGVKTVVDRTSNNMLSQSWQVLSHAGETQPSALIISAIVIVAALICTYFLPKAPAPLLGVIAAVAGGDHVWSAPTGSRKTAARNTAIRRLFMDPGGCSGRDTGGVRACVCFRSQPARYVARGRALSRPS